MSKRHKSREADILVYDEMHPNEDAVAVGKRFGVSGRSVERYRQYLREGDEELADLVAYRFEQLNRALGHEMIQAMREAIGFVRRAFTEGNPTPDMIEKVTVFFATMADARIGFEILDAQLDQITRAEAAADRAGAGFPYFTPGAWGGDGASATA